MLYAQGREPNSGGLNLAQAGIDAPDGWIAVNEHFQTSVPHIFAVGDLIGRPALASTGMEQGRAAVLYAFGGAEHDMAENLPMAVYTIPEISYVGKTEKEVQKENIPYIIGRAYFKHSARGQIIGDAQGMLKLIVDARNEKLLGVHIVGEQASELVHIGQLVMNLHGTVRDLISNVFNYPDAGRVLQTRGAGLHAPAGTAQTFPTCLDMAVPGFPLNEALHVGWPFAVSTIIRRLFTGDPGHIAFLPP